MRVRRFVAAGAAMLAVAACDQPATPPPTAAPSPSPATAVTRPLRLPTIAPGAACPTTRSHPGPDTETQVLGDGPLYPVAYYFSTATTLELRGDDRRPDGMYVKKVRWIGSGYTGPVLVRAGRIDGPGTATVTFSYIGEPRDGGHYVELTSPDYDIPATTTVSGPGCYAYQVDGTTFTTTIVFRAA